MRRLNFKLDEFVRVSWVSSRAQEKWAPIFSDLSNKFIMIERQAVKLRMRRVALQHTSDLLGLTKEMMSQGLSVIPLELTNVMDSYASATPAFNPNLPIAYKVAIGRHENTEKFLMFYYQFDQEGMGHLLGYPECCRKFFNQYWIAENWFDTTLPMLEHDGFDTPLENLVDIDPRNNILLRWLGLRPVSHLPCSFHCEATKSVADTYAAAARLSGMEKDWAALIDILSWPVEWNSLHGIAQIVTPVCKITAATDALPYKRTVRLANNLMPDEAGSGVDFPFIKDTWTENGFLSFKGMKEAHDKIINALKNYKPKSVIDLGCGNMALLHRIKKDFGIATWGVDQDKSKRPDQVANIWDVKFSNYDFVLIANQRLEESPESWARLEKELEQNHIGHILIYDHNTAIISIRTLHGQTSLAK